MIVGLYAAASGLLTQEHRQAVIANNIANASTAGFKAQRPVDKGFNELLFRKMRDPFWANRVTAPGGGVNLDETFTDYSSGPLNLTGNALDVAIQGPGFLSIETPSGVRYTRSGNLSMDGAGDLMTPQGLPVLGTNGARINALGSRVEILEDGTVLADGQPRGVLQLTEFEDPHMLTREGHDLYTASPEAMQRSAPAANTKTISGTLEMANIQLPREMVNMMLAVRAYSSNQRVVQTMDETVSRLIESVGMAG